MSFRLPCYIYCLALCFVLVFFCPISIAITSLGKKRAGLCAFCAVVCFALVGLCLFLLPLGVRNWLRLVIVAHPELFYLAFLDTNKSNIRAQLFKASLA